MRTKLDNAQCAHVWAAQSQSEGRGGNGQSSAVRTYPLIDKHQRSLYRTH
jgi:hypothetical protein